MSALAAICPSVLITATWALIAVVGGEPLAQAQGTGMFNAMTLNTATGAEIYRRICQGCHMPDGQGAAGAGRYPTLAKNPALRSAQYMAVTILAGGRNMPGFGTRAGSSSFLSPPSLTDEQVAAVINYVRTHFGNRYTDTISAAQVERLHHSR
jgi:mono/diheme cytochrome c family protein